MLSRSMSQLFWAEAQEQEERAPAAAAGQPRLGLGRRYSHSNRCEARSISPERKADPAAATKHAGVAMHGIEDVAWRTGSAKPLAICCLRYHLIIRS